MRKVILNLALTLDGFIEGPNGEIDWIVKDSKIDFGDVLCDILSDNDKASIPVNFVFVLF